MNSGTTPLNRQRRTLRNRIIAWSFVPTAIILLAVALVTYFAYQDLTQTLVIERDEQLTRLSASQFFSKLSPYADELTTLARTTTVRQGTPDQQQQALDAASNRLVVFDGGVVLLDTFGRVRASYPERPELRGQDWSSREYFRQIVSLSKPTFSNVLPDGIGGAEVVALAVPTLGDRGEFLGTLVGMFRIGPTAVSAFYGSIVTMRIGQTGSPYLVDGTGRVIYHQDNEQVGEDFSSQPVVQAVLQGQSDAVRTRDLQGADIVAAYAPVPGTPWGIISEERWDSLNRLTRSFSQVFVLLLAMGVIVPTLVVAVGVRRITQPINDLIDAAREVARGKFGRTIQVTSGDEIETLARQFNQMSVQLQESYARLEQQVAERTEALYALNAIAAVASRSQDLTEVLEQTLQMTLRVMKFDAGGILLRDDASSQLSLAAHRGLDTEARIRMDDLGLGEGILGQAAQSGEPLVVENLASETRLTCLVAGPQGFQSLASVPLLSSGQTLGVLFGLTRSQRPLTQQDLELLTSIGHQMGVAVENTRLLAQARTAAAVEERQRLARELHDAVTQTLFSASLIAEVLPRLWDRYPEEGRQRLEELRQLTRGALAEMRALLMELRPASLIEAPLGDVLRQLSEAFIGRTRVPVDFAVQGECKLPADVQVALYRIAQETLNNVAKHAGASQVVFHLHCRPEAVELIIRDDGCGFEPGRLAPEHLGLGIMRERADAVGASLSVESQPGHGTTVSVVWRP